MLGKIEGRRRRGRQRMRWLDGITDSMDMSFEQALGVGDGQGGLSCCNPWGCKELDMTKRLHRTDCHGRVGVGFITGISWIEARDADMHPTTHSTATLRTKSSLIQSVHGTAAEEPCLMERHFPSVSLRPKLILDKALVDSAFRAQHQHTHSLTVLFICSPALCKVPC